VVLQADVINDIHDLEDATLELVAGVANFMHGEPTSALACLAEMPRLGKFFQAPGRAAAAYFPNVMVSRSRMAEVARAPREMDEAGQAEFAVPDSVVSQGVQDLFYYTRDDVTLAKGERAAFHLFKVECPAEEMTYVYTAYVRP